MTSNSILYYISSHGFGHAARAGQVIRELSKKHTVLIKTMAPEWLLERVVEKKVTLFAQQFDVGCIQTNNMDVDVKKTLLSFQNQTQKNRSSLEDELLFIKKNKVSLIVSDIPSFPFVVAKKASLPSVFVGNFTWLGIYDFYIKDRSHPLIEQLRWEYSLADKALVTPLAMHMPELQNKSQINFIARTGKNIRSQLNKDFSIPVENKLVFLYSGNLGTEEMKSYLVEKNSGYTFLSFYPLHPPPKNYIWLQDNRYKHQDIMASSDIALVKPGYGMVSEAMVNGIPIIYPPRTNFAEYFAFESEFKRSGGVIQISREQFDSGDWAEALSKVSSIGYKKRYSDAGALECCNAMEKVLNWGLNGVK